MGKPKGNDLSLKLLIRIKSGKKEAHNQLDGSWVITDSKGGAYAVWNVIEGGLV